MRVLTLRPESIPKSLYGSIRSIHSLKIEFISEGIIIHIITISRHFLIIKNIYLLMQAFIDEMLEASIKDILPIMQERIVNKTKYFGVPTQKNPLDAWRYQEIIFDLRPDVIIEIGNFSGGGLFFIAQICDLLDHGRVIGLDISHQSVPEKVRVHPRITLIEGDACQNLPTVRKLISINETVLIIEDSSHTFENTLNILRTYSIFIKPSFYFIVEDGICHHGLDIGPEPGPFEAIEQFIEENADFEIDRSNESFFITWNPKGFLRRIR